MQTKSYKSCRLCFGSRFDPDRINEWCPRCNGTARDPESIEVEAIQQPLVREFVAKRMDHPPDNITYIELGYQRAKQTTPSNAPTPCRPDRSAAMLAYVLIWIWSVVSFAVGVAVGKWCL